MYESKIRYGSYVMYVTYPNHFLFLTKQGRPGSVVPMGWLLRFQKSVAFMSSCLALIVLYIQWFALTQASSSCS